jgi:hypothetical protein
MPTSVARKHPEPSHLEKCESKLQRLRQDSVFGQWPVKRSSGGGGLEIVLKDYQEEMEGKALALSGEIMDRIASTQRAMKKHAVIYADSLQSVPLQKQLLGLCLQLAGSGRNYMVRSGFLTRATNPTSSSPCIETRGGGGRLIRG